MYHEDGYGASAWQLDLSSSIHRFKIINSIESSCDEAEIKDLEINIDMKFEATDGSWVARMLKTHGGDNTLWVSGEDGDFPGPEKLIEATLEVWYFTKDEN